MYSCCDSFLHHDLSRHFFADGDPRFLDVHDHVPGQGGEDGHAAAHHKAQVLQMLLDLRASADLLNDVFFSYFFYFLSPSMIFALELTIVFLGANLEKKNSILYFKPMT